MRWKCKQDDTIQHRTLTFFIKNSTCKNENKKTFLKDELLYIINGLKINHSGKSFKEPNVTIKICYVSFLRLTEIYIIPNCKTIVVQYYSFSF